MNMVNVDLTMTSQSMNSYLNDFDISKASIPIIKPQI